MSAPEHARAESLLSAEKRTLEMIANRVSLPEVLDDLCHTIDAHLPGVISTVLLMDSDGKRLWLGAGPRFPAVLKSTVFPWPIGPGRAACGTAAFLKQRVIISDVTTDPRFPDEYRSLAVSHGLRASWSEPLISKHGAVLGTFAMYYAEPRVPDTSDLEVIEAAGHIALIAIQMERSQAALRDREEQFRLVANTAPVMIWMSGVDGLCTYGNQTWLKFTGRTLEAVLENGWAESLHPEDVTRSLDTYRRAFGRREPFQIEHRLRRHDGEYRWILDQGVPRFDTDGSFAGYIGSGIDITERKLAEESLQNSDERLRLAMESGKSVGWDRDVRSGRDSLFGDLQSVFGIPSEVYYGRVEDFHRYVHPEDRGRVLEAIDYAMQSQKPYAAEFRLLWPDGTVRWLAAKGKFYCSRDGEPERMLGVAIDVTDRKLAEEALHEREERFRLAVQAGRMYAFDWDVATDVIVRSEESTQIFGLTGEPVTLTKRELLDHVHPEDRATFINSIAECTPESPNTQISYRLLRPDGSVLWLERTGRAFFDEQGRMLRMIGMVADVTERKLAENRLQEYERAVEGLEEMIVVVDREYRYLIANNKFLKMRNMTKEQVVGRFANEVLNKGVFESVVRQKLDECFQGKVVRYEMKYTYPDLGERDLFISYFPIQGPTGVDRVVCIMQDITERRRTEEAFRRSEGYLAEAQRLAHCGSWAWDVSTRDVFWSDEMFRILGYNPEETRPSLSHFLTRVHPEDRLRVEQVVKDETSGLDADIETDYRIVLPDGTVKQLHASAHPVKNRSGEVVEVVGTSVDVTEHKLAEKALRESEERFRLAAQAGKMYAFDWDVVTDEIVRSEESTHIFGLTGEPMRVTHRELLARIHPGDRETFISSIAECTPDRPNTQIRYRLLRPDGSVLWLERTGHAFFNEQGKMVRMIGMVIDVTERKLAEEALSTVSQKLIEAQEEERSRLARELHDDINQKLALLAVNLESLKQGVPASVVELGQRIAETSKQVGDIGKDIQALSHRLHSPKLEYLGLATAAASFCKEFSDQQKVEIAFHSESVPKELPQEISLCLFRVLQEALQNASKHSGSRQLEVSLNGRASEIELTVQDSGIGFEPQEAMKGRGLGLTSMQERLKLVEGHLSIESKPQRGTTIHARAPINPKTKSAGTVG